MCQPVRCGIQLPASRLEIANNSIFLEHISSVVQAWKANVSPWKCQTYTYSIISGCKNHTADSCCRPQEHTGLTQQAFGVHWKSKVFWNHLAYCMCTLQPRTDIPARTMAGKIYCTSISAFLYSLMQIKTKPLMDFHLTLKTDD